jgi:hypothetical protein
MSCARLCASSPPSFLRHLASTTAWGVILLAIERYPENGALLTGVLVLFLESICVLMVVGGAHARGKHRSAGFPLDDPNQEPRT